ncbi:unnamed protein product [Periconia digitata]|uniref:Uncharacterized protein n=1 Tax=Periconia digitata TaxID=1303443 RepID=A0A9W4XG84_9PLEO|nr:unnamed protein product [Periconia digitata]
MHLVSKPTFLAQDHKHLLLPTCLHQRPLLLDDLIFQFINSQVFGAYTLAVNRNIILVSICRLVGMVL